MIPEEIFNLIQGNIQLYQTCKYFYYYRYLYYQSYVVSDSKINLVIHPEDVYQLSSNFYIDRFPNLTHLTLNNFNQPLTLTNHLKHLTLGNRFNQPLTLTNHLKHLTLGYSFNQPLD